MILTEEDIQAFEMKQREEEKSDATIEKYGSTLRRFRDWSAGEEITRAKLVEYRNFLHKDHLEQTVNEALSAINAFLDNVGRRDLQIKHLKVQHQTFREPEKELSREEYERLVQTAKEQGDERLALLLATICSSGIRVSEAQYITVEAAKCRKTEVYLKGKIRTIFLTKAICTKFLAYAKEHNIKSGQIFLTRNGKPMSRQQIWAEMKALCQAAGVEPSKVFPHNLRHLFARCYYETKNDIEQLADVLGHSSIETTRLYLLSTGEQHIQTLERMGLVS